MIATIETMNSRTRRTDTILLAIQTIAPEDTMAEGEDTEEEDMHNQEENVDRMMIDKEIEENSTWVTILTDKATRDTQWMG